MERALYDPELGFYESGGAGRRRGHFITSPEVGPLFGAVIARVLDQQWDKLGQPAGFTVVDAGAGPGTLARTVAKAQPRCWPDTRWINVERTAAGRAAHTVGHSQADMPGRPITGVILANELLDNLPLSLFTGDNQGGANQDGANQEVGNHFVDPSVRLRPHQVQACIWLTKALETLERGTVIVIDYMSSTEEMSKRPWPEWLRTYRGHQRGDHPWADPGTQDITCEVALDQLAAVRPPTRCTSQAAWLKNLGIEELVAEGAAIWRAGAAQGGLEALTGRSRTTEAAALLDAGGLGGFTVAEWDV